MSAIPPASDAAQSSAESELSRLTGRVEAMRSVLVRLLQDVVQAETTLGHSGATDLVEANEKLVVAALLSQVDTDAAFQALDAADRASKHDPLTGLPNRALLLDRFEQAIANAKRHGTRLALLFLDLDHFKQINDAAGHAAGDEVLRLVAHRLESAVRAVDTVSRHGGDEFLVLLTEVASPLDASVIADKLLAAIAAPHDIAAVPMPLRASIGIGIYPDDGQDPAALIARADAAMYQAKRGGGSYAFHGRPAAAPPAGLPERPGPDAARLHAQLREANEQLVLAALGARELQAAAERAQQRQAAFMSAVALELRNPMAPVRIAAAMLGREGADEQLLKRVNGIVEQQMAQMARLVGDVLDVGHAGGVALLRTPEVVDMAGVIAAAAAAARPWMEARRQPFSLQLPPQALPVLGDRDRLRQIVGNLIDNASKHTLDGGRIALTVELAEDAQSMTMTVSDGGIGMAPQMLPHVFEPFVQDTPAVGLHGGGLGIGLTATRALVEAHGGSIAAHSAGPGLGSRFVVTLALVQGADPA